MVPMFGKKMYPIFKLVQLFNSDHTLLLISSLMFDFTMLFLEGMRLFSTETVGLYQNTKPNNIHIVLGSGTVVGQRTRHARIH